MPSLFRQIARYPSNPAMDPGENRLTASFASVLERVSSLAATLVADWIGEQPSEPVWVRTQRATVGGRFVDLELCFGSPVAPELRVWVEVKHGAELGELQLENYAQDLALETQVRSQLVLLAPRDAMPAVSAGAIAVEWQQLARRLLEARKAFASGSADAWLVDEFVRYLKEEGLSDQEALTHPQMCSSCPLDLPRIAHLAAWSSWLISMCSSSCGPACQIRRAPVGRSGQGGGPRSIHRFPVSRGRRGETDGSNGRCERILPARSLVAAMRSSPARPFRA